MVYFTLERITKPKQGSNPRRTRNTHLMVSTIRSNAKSKEHNTPPAADHNENRSFNIFDGTPDQDSPWARYINQDDYDEEDDMRQEDASSASDGAL